MQTSADGLNEIIRAQVDAATSFMDAFKPCLLCPEKSTKLHEFLRSSHASFTLKWGGLDMHRDSSQFEAAHKSARRYWERTSRRRDTELSEIAQRATDDFFCSHILLPFLREIDAPLSVPVPEADSPSFSLMGKWPEGRLKDEELYAIRRRLPYTIVSCHLMRRGKVIIPQSLKKTMDPQRRVYYYFYFADRGKSLQALRDSLRVWRLLKWVAVRCEGRPDAAVAVCSEMVVCRLNGTADDKKVAWSMRHSCMLMPLRMPAEPAICILLPADVTGLAHVAGRAHFDASTPGS